MGTQLKMIQSVSSKGKSSSKLHQAADELDHVITFNHSITRVMAHTMQDLSDGVFINVANLTLACRDSYLKAGIKQDTLRSLRTAPNHKSALFPDHIISKAEEICHHEDKCTSGPSGHTGNLNLSTLTVSLPDSSKTLTGRPVDQYGSKLEGVDRDLTGARPPLTLNDQQSPSNSVNDNYCVSCVAGNSVCVPRTSKGTCSINCERKDSLVTELAGKNDCFVTCNKEAVRTLTINSCLAVDHVHFANGYPQQKGVNPNYCYLSQEIKHVSDVSYVDQLSSVKNVTNVSTVVPDLPVRARLHQFWKKLAALRVSLKVLAVLREGYTLPFQFWPNLTRSPTITSCYVNPHRNLYLLEALHQLLNKNAVELVKNQESLGFYNRLFLIPKPNNQWRPILDLSTLNTFPKTESLKMETPVLPIQSTAIWSVHSPHGVYSSGQTGQVSCTTKGYKDPTKPVSSIHRPW